MYKHMWLIPTVLGLYLAFNADSGSRTIGDKVEAQRDEFEYCMNTLPSDLPAYRRQCFRIMDTSK